MADRSDIKIVKFLYKMGSYSAGEVAGFPSETAKRIVEEGLGEIVKHSRAKLDAKAEEETRDKQMKADPTSRKDYVTK